jgi:hypothetical protein
MAILTSSAFTSLSSKAKKSDISKVSVKRSQKWQAEVCMGQKF